MRLKNERVTRTLFVPDRFHKDTFDLPAGAVLLASSRLYPNQAFSVGKTLALQFHPEADEAGCKAWFVSNAGLVAAGRMDLAGWRADTGRYLPKMMAQTEKMLREWLSDVGLIPAPRPLPRPGPSAPSP